MSDDLIKSTKRVLEPKERISEVHKASDPQKEQRIIADSLPPVVASILQPAELDTMRQRLQELPEPPGATRG